MAINIKIGTFALFVRNVVFSPKRGTDTSRVGAFNFLQNPLVLRYTLQGTSVRHDCCVCIVAASAVVNATLQL